MSPASVFALVFLFYAATVTAQGEVVWNLRPLTAADQRSILELAAMAGVARPRLAREPVVSQCRVVLVDSDKLVEGNRVRFKTIYVRQRSGPGCQPFVAGREVYESGNWMVSRAATNTTDTELWRIRDDAWFVDVYLPPDIAYERAVAIVLALHRGAVVDVRKPGALGLALANLDRLNRFVQDTAMTRLMPDSWGNLYLIYTDDFRVISIRTRDGRIEFEGVSTWQP